MVLFSTGCQFLMATSHKSFCCDGTLVFHLIVMGVYQNRTCFQIISIFVSRCHFLSFPPLCPSLSSPSTLSIHFFVVYILYSSGLTVSLPPCSYNLESSTWDVVPINSGPLQRYGHSLALYQVRQIMATAH